MLDLNNILALAPMAGFSDPPFRKLARRFKADLTISEMVSANALLFQNEKTLAMLKTSESPFIVQLLAADEEILAKAVKLLNHYDFISGIDLNCGCPVKKVIKQGGGAYLLQDKEKLKRLLSTLKKYNQKKYSSAKLRLGFNEVDYEPASICEQEGLDFISVHARTRADFYQARPKYQALKELKARLKIPIIANGDINPSNAQNIREETGINSLMIGRAAIGRPWVFHEIKEGFINLSLKKELILAHFEELKAHYKKQALIIFRKHLHEYSKNHQNAAKFREEINHIKDEQSMQKCVYDFFS